MSWHEKITPDFTTKLKRDKNYNNYAILSIFNSTPRVYDGREFERALTS